MATDGLFPWNYSIIVRLFKCTFDHSVLFTNGIYTYFIIAFKCWCYPAEFPVINIFPLLFYFFYRSFCKIGFDLLVHLINDRQFFILKGCTGVTVFATTTFTFGQVTNELRFYHIIAYMLIINYYHFSYFLQMYLRIFFSPPGKNSTQF